MSILCMTLVALFSSVAHKTKLSVSGTSGPQRVLRLFKVLRQVRNVEQVGACERVCARAPLYISKLSLRVACVRVRVVGTKPIGPRALYIPEICSFVIFLSTTE